MKKVSYSPVFSCGEGGEEVGESQIMTGKRLIYVIQSLKVHFYNI